MSQPKIVHVTSVHSPFDSRIFQKECSSLVRAGYDVSLVAPHARGEVVEGINVIPVAGDFSRPARMTKFARRVIGRAAQVNAAIYHLHDPELLPWCGPLRRQKAIVVFDMHEDLPFQLRNKPWIAPVLRPAASFVARIGERIWLRNVPTVFAESSYGNSRPWLKETADVLNFPRFDVLDKLGRKPAGSGKFTIGYLGTVTPERGSFRNLNALSLVQGAGADVQFECVGKISSAHQSEWEEYVAQKRIANVDLVGYLPPQEGWARMANWDVGLSVLEPIPNYLESYPTKLFEYMCMGIPAIVSDFPLYREIVEKYECGLLVDPLDSQSVAEAITHLMTHPELAVQMGNRGKEAARKNYSWESEESNLLEFYESLLKARA